MHVEHRTTVGAAPQVVFQIYEDVTHWHTWDPDTRQAVLDGPLRTGARGTFTPTKGRAVPMQVTAVVPGRSFTVACRIPGLRMVFEHTLTPGPAGTEVVHRATFSGLLSWVIGPLLCRQLTAGLPVTLAGLKQQAEARSAA